MKKPSVDAICLQCWKKFKTWPYKIKMGQGKFCSLKCYLTPRDLEKRFWENVKKTPTCWLWTKGGGSGKWNYGHLSWGKNNTLTTHRISWELHFGKIPKGLMVCHKCDNPPCVNPEHLFLGTKGDNIRDCAKKGRTARGDKNGSRLYPERYPRGEKSRLAILTASQVIEARKLYATGTIRRKELAKKLNVSESNVKTFLSRRSWKHI